MSNINLTCTFKECKYSAVTIIAFMATMLCLSCGETEPAGPQDALDWCWEQSKTHPDGFTVDILRRQHLSEGIAVGYAETQNSLGKEGLRRCIEFASNRTGIVGGWYDDGKYYFDADTIFQESMLPEALQWARKNKQRKIYILSKQEYVDVPDSIAHHEEGFTGDRYGDLYSPYIVFDDTLSMGHHTSWTCVMLGSYPQAEVVESRFAALDDYAVKPGDVIIDAVLFGKLSTATWVDNETTIDGVRYRRMKGEDAVHYAVNSRGYYRWDNPELYHYFRYEPVKWRILNISGSKALLLADRALDCHRFNETDTDVNWGTSTLREWMNTEMFGKMFTEREKTFVLQTEVVNSPNHYFGTYCGEDTRDHLFILSESETFSSPLAKKYGFWPADGIDDSARRFKPTMYEACRGGWISMVEDYRGNTYWLMRSTGYTPNNVTYVCEFGYLYNRGTLVTCADGGIIPAMTIDLDAANLKPCGKVSSLDVLQ